MGWILVMFDLPVQTKKEQRQATKFRNFLLDDGYIMMQYSVYMRSCSSYERMSKHTHRIKKKIPHGNVKIIFITDKQWEKALNVTPEERETIAPTKQMQLCEFW